MKEIFVILCCKLFSPWPKTYGPFGKVAKFLAPEAADADVFIFWLRLHTDIFWFRDRVWFKMRRQYWEKRLGFFNA